MFHRYSKLAGVTFSNSETGMNRQRIISKLSRSGELSAGTELKLLREPNNRYDRNAIAVYSPGGEQLGYLSRNDAANVAPKIDRGEKCKVIVQQVTGGDAENVYGVNILIEIGEAASSISPTPTKFIPSGGQYIREETISQKHDLEGDKSQKATQGTVSVGDTVYHNYYGKGKICEATDQYWFVKFEGETKTFQFMNPSAIGTFLFLDEVKSPQKKAEEIKKTPKASIADVIEKKEASPQRPSKPTSDTGICSKCKSVVTTYFGRKCPKCGGEILDGPINNIKLYNGRSQPQTLDEDYDGSPAGYVVSSFDSSCNNGHSKYAGDLSDEFNPDDFDSSYYEPEMYEPDEY